MEWNGMLWVLDRRSKMLQVSRKMIMLKAKVFYGELAKENLNCYDDKFEASTECL